MSGLHRDSHIPYSCSVHVPLTTKSSVSMGQPIRSMAAMNGSLVLGPAQRSWAQQNTVQTYGNDETSAL